MKLIIISIISSILAGMGIGGGALFVLLSTTFLNVSQVNAQGLNLILFITVGISATITNVRDKKIDYEILKKILFPLIIGSLIGTFFLKQIQQNDLKKYFSIFLVIIGIYEIISSVISIIKAKNNTRELKRKERKS